MTRVSRHKTRHNALAATCVATMIAASPALADGNPLSFQFGNDSSLTFYGYVKLDAIHDADYGLGNTTGSLKNIGLPSGPATGSFDRFNLRESRIGLDLRLSDTLFKVEGDFYGPDGKLRLRHAYVSWNGLLVGQNWSNFMSVETLPSTVDFQGPAGVPFARLPQVRYTFNPNQDWQISASVEEDISNTDDAQFTLASRHQFDAGMVRVAGLYRDTSISGMPFQGWGLSVSGAVNAWDGGTVSGYLTAGEGVSDILAFGLDPLTAGGDPIGVQALVLSVKQEVTDRLTLVASAGLTNMDVAVGDDTKQLTTLHLSAFYDVTDNFSLGGELFTGLREQGDGLSFRANRVQLSAKFTF